MPVFPSRAPLCPAPGWQSCVQRPIPPVHLSQPSQPLGAPPWQSTSGFCKWRNNACELESGSDARGKVRARRGGRAAGAGPPALPPPPSLPTRLLAPAVLRLGQDRQHWGRCGRAAASRAEEDWQHPDTPGRQLQWHLQSRQRRQKLAGAPARSRLAVQGRRGLVVADEKLGVGLRGCRSSSKMK